MHYDHRKHGAAAQEAAFRTLPAFNVGDAVTVTNDGKTYEKLFVTRKAMRSDGAYGSWESTHIIVSFGVGRYAFSVTAEKLATGAQSISPA